MEDIARVLLDWHVILIAGCLLLVFPLVFYVSSLDKSPVKVRKIRMPEKKRAARPAERARVEETRRRPPEGRHRPAPDYRRPPEERREPPAARPQAPAAAEPPPAGEPKRFEEPNAEP